MNSQPPAKDIYPVIDGQRYIKINKRKTSELT